MKVAFIIRGVPGSGKTTLANEVAPDYNVAADDWFDKFNEGKFAASMLREAHNYCGDVFLDFVETEKSPIAVHNTFTRISEYEWYKDVAEKHDYHVFVITVEHRHNGESEHNVPQQTIEKMKNRFELTL